MTAILSDTGESAYAGKRIKDTIDELIGVQGTPERNEYESLLLRKIASAKLRETHRQGNLLQKDNPDESTTNQRQ